MERDILAQEGGSADIPMEEPSRKVTDSKVTQPRQTDAGFDITCVAALEPPLVDPMWIRRQWFNDVKIWSDRGHNVLIVGPPGSGKTSGAQQLAAMLELPFIRLSLDNSRDLREIFGRWAIIVDGGASRTVFVHSLFLSMCLNPGKGAVVLLDEVNFVDPQRGALLHELLDNRRVFVKEANGGMGMVLEIPENIRFLLACNPPSAAFGGTQRMNAALGDRGATVVAPPIGKAMVNQLLKRWMVEKKLADALSRLFLQAEKLVRQQNLRIQVSIRSLRRIVDGINSGIPIRRAILQGLVNAAVVLGDNVGKDALTGLIRTELPPGLADDKEDEDADS